jgi:glycerol uptake facilitator-like aquaporin
MRPGGDGLTMADLARRLSAEALGTQALLAAVVGSGIMGERLSGGNDAIALLANAVATGAALVVLITILSPVSGAHFNPAVTLAAALRREISWAMAGAYVLAQTAGAVGGVMMAHAMFELPIVEVSTRARDGVGQGISEMIATFGLVAGILGCARWRPAATPAIVGLYVTAGYWFTASTGFANPAVTLARSLTDTFTGIAPASVPLFVAAQIAGALAAVGVAGWLFGVSHKPD